MIGQKSRLHGHAIFGVVSVSDTGTGTTRRIPVSGECPLFFSFLRHAPTWRRHSSDASDTPAVKKKRKFRHISGHSGYSGQFRPKWKFRPIQDFDWKKKKKKIKIKIKILPPPSGFRAFLPPHLLLNFGLFFFLFFFFFFFWFRSATWLTLLLYLCVLAVLHLCLEFRL